MLSAFIGMEKEFWRQLSIKTLVMLGFTYFSVAVATQSFETILPSIGAAGLYFFTELVRFYKLDVDNTKLKAMKKKTKSLSFLI